MGERSTIGTQDGVTFIAKPETYDRLDVVLNTSMDGCPNPGVEIVPGTRVLPEVTLRNGAVHTSQEVVSQVKQ